jgi:hypothetical protein
LARRRATPTVTTTHGRLDGPEEEWVCRRFPAQPRIAISDAQRAQLPGANWLATIHSGIECARFHSCPDAGGYLVFLGRISPEKRPDRAISIARDAGMRLVMAAKVDPADAGYYEHVIAPMIRANPCVEFIGEVDDREKDKLLGGTYAYVFDRLARAVRADDGRGDGDGDAGDRIAGGIGARGGTGWRHWLRLRFLARHGGRGAHTEDRPARVPVARRALFLPQGTRLLHDGVQESRSSFLCSSRVATREDVLCC